MPFSEENGRVILDTWNGCIIILNILTAAAATADVCAFQFRYTFLQLSQTFYYCFIVLDQCLKLRVCTLLMI